MTTGPHLDQYDLAPIPPIDAELVETHTAGQQQLADELDAADPLTHQLFRHIQLRLVSEGIAGVDRIAGDLSEMLVPPKRRWLARPRSLRLEGCALALRHVDTRLTMRRFGLLHHVNDLETAKVLHAFVEAGTPHGNETNAGSIRATPTKFAPGDSTFVPPPPEHCASLLRSAIELANVAPAPAVVRAGWLLSAVFAIHPFVDGNGRTARLLLHGALSEASPAGFDWGTQTELATDRVAYVLAARSQTEPSLPDYDARRLEPQPLMEFVIRRSIEANRLAVRRLAMIDSVVRSAVESGFDEHDAILLLAVAADRNVGLAELERLGMLPDEVTERVNGLVGRRHLLWDHRGKLQIVGANPFIPLGRSTYEERS